MFVLAILAAAGKHNKKMRNIAKLPRASRAEMMLASHASMGENNNKRGGSTAKGNKRISASQPPEGDYELAVLLHDMLESSPALSAAKVLVPPSHLALSYLKMFDSECQSIVPVYNDQCRASYQRKKIPTASYKENLTPPDRTLTQPGMKRSSPDPPAPRHKGSPISAPRRSLRLSPSLVEGKLYHIMHTACIK